MHSYQRRTRHAKIKDGKFIKVMDLSINTRGTRVFEVQKIMSGSIEST